MIERLLENWLDSASERSYQPVFVQMLAAKGYRVLHSTRHNVLEFGKDILAVAPDGVPCAFQLKGHPRGRLGLNQFRAEIQPQLVQLMSQPIVYPGFPTQSHRSFLVTNGYFEEEVMVAVQQMNSGPYMSKVELLSRGELLAWARELGPGLWPFELSDTKTLLELILADPEDQFPKSKLAALLSETLSCKEDNDKVRAPDLARRVTSAAVLCGIASSPFAVAENHSAEITSWVLLAAAVIAACEKHEVPLTGPIGATLDLIEETIGASLVLLWREVSSRKTLVEGNALADAEVYGWRCVVLAGLLTCLHMKHESRSVLSEQEERSLKQWLLHPPGPLDLWGESAIPAIVTWLLWLRRHDATIRVDNEIAAIAEIVIQRNQRGSPAPLASPYYELADLVEHRLELARYGAGRSIVGDETFAGSAYFAETLLHLLARTNLKSKCKSIWPSFTRIGVRRSIPDFPWTFGLLRFEKGVDETVIPPREKGWLQLKAEALATSHRHLPGALVERPYLLALWCQVAPYRFSTAVSSALVAKGLPGWGE